MSLAAKASSILKTLCRRIPFVGRLGEVSRESCKQAFFETITTTLFATMPFWVLPTLGYFIFQPRPSFNDTLRHGEGLIYASVLLGPLVYVITRRYGRFNLVFTEKKTLASTLSMSFPYGGSFVIVTALTCAIAGFSFAELQRTSSTDPGLNQHGVAFLSWILMFGATGIFFLVAAYGNMLDDIEKNKTEMVVEEQPRQEDAFLSGWLGSKS
jgi:hypothetical protein